MGRTASPAALASTILARIANSCGVVGARNHDSSVARSSLVTFIRIGL